MWYRFTHSIIGTIILAALLGFVSYRMFGMVRDTLVLKEEDRHAQRQIEELTKKKAELQAHLAELQTVQAAERAAKERLNVKKEGEHVVVVVPAEDTATTTAPAHPSLWTRIKEFFGIEP